MGGNFGRFPENLLKLRSSRVNLERENRVFGIDPDRKLPERSSSWIDLRLPMEEGRIPEKELDRRVRDWRREREEREAGMEP